MPNLCVVCFILIDAHIDCFLVAIFYFCRIDDTLEKTLENLDKRLSTYLRSVFLSPLNFILTSHYKTLCEYTIESLFQHDDVVPVQIIGPKGVGKSTSLFVLAINLTVLQQSTKASDTVVLYFTESLLLNFYSTITQNYLEANNLICTVDNIAECLICSEDKKFVVLGNVMILEERNC